MYASQEINHKTGYKAYFEICKKKNLFWDNIIATEARIR